MIPSQTTYDPSLKHHKAQTVLNTDVCRSNGAEDQVQLHDKTYLNRGIKTLWRETLQDRPPNQPSIHDNISNPMPRQL
jgi:hypothetical protein